MSTRCFIDFVNENVRIYKHQDGYPIENLIHKPVGMIPLLSKFYLSYCESINLGNSRNVSTYDIKDTHGIADKPKARKKLIQI